MLTFGCNGHVVLSQTSEDSALWRKRQNEVTRTFMHAWKGYTSYALGHDELQPVSKSGTDGLGGLGATVIDALDTAMIMGLDNVVQDAGSWIQKELLGRIAAKGQVNPRPPASNSSLTSPYVA